MFTTNKKYKKKLLTSTTSSLSILSDSDTAAAAAVPIIISKKNHQHFHKNNFINKKSIIKPVVKINYDKKKKLITDSSSFTSTVLNRQLINANWNNFKMTTEPSAAMSKKKKSHPSMLQLLQANKVDNILMNSKGTVKLTKYIAMDCEMVGIGYMGKKHMLARVSIVNQCGDILLDKYVRPTEPVIDYRTSISGIRPENIENATDFHTVQRDVENLLKNRILIGHAVHNDLKVLNLTHMKRYIRDTSKYKPLLKLITGGATPSLKILTHYILGYDIQCNEHSSVEDARAAMQIYNKYSRNWEIMIRQRDLS